MKNFQLESILLVSHQEKKARRVTFHPKLTIIKGANDTGKSSLIKSIYRGFGAEPPKVHRKWKDANVSTLIHFRIDQKRLAILRSAGEYSIFDENNELLGSYASITNELAPALAELLGFKLRLLSRDGIPSVPPPAYFFLPFYIDQDEGWVKPWQSFRNLSQFPNWRKPVASYHFGLRPDQWYELDAQKRAESEKRILPEKEIAALSGLEKKTRTKLARVDFDIDIEAFKSEIRKLLKACNDLSVREETYRNKIVELRTEKIRIEAQIEIVERTRSELSADYAFAVDHDGACVGCPMCGQEYENSFLERFEIAKDEETCSDLLQSLQVDLRKINDQIELVQKSLASNSKDQQHIANLLSEKKGEVVLSDLVKLEGKKELLNHLEIEINSQEQVLSEIDRAIVRISSEMESFDDPSRARRILERYEHLFRKHAFSLNVHGLSDRTFASIYASIEESGSDQPRAVLAYQFAMLDAISNKGDATLCPIVIDAPNQQEQDPENLEKIIRFIPDNCPNGSQVVLALVDDAGINFEGKLIHLENKFSLLDEEFYRDGAKELRVYEVVQLEAQRRRG